MGLINQIEGNRIYLDTNIFIYLFESFSPYIDILSPVIEKVELGQFHSYTSELTIAEALVKPIMEKNTQWQSIYIQGIQSSPSLTVEPIHRTILIEAARLRSEIGLKLPDAIHYATAIHSNCTAFLTNDKQMKSIKNLNVIQLDDFK
ncbi:MAG: type II toxin-antitoxin system VapC family toxin [Candidatus Omnitrophota bacterium]